MERKHKKIKVDLWRFRVEYLSRHFNVTRQAANIWVNNGEIPIKYEKQLKELEEMEIKDRV